MYDFFKDSIYKNVYKNQNWITNDWDKYKAKYSSGYSSSSYWLDLEDNEEENSLKTKSDLNYALVQVSKCVNLIRHKFGIGEKKALKVKWADSPNFFNSSDDEYVYLCPSPLLTRSTLTLKQRYDVIVGQAMLSSVQKHIVPSNLYNFINHLSQLTPELKIEIHIDCEKMFFKYSNGSTIPYIQKLYRTVRVNSRTVREQVIKDQIDYIPYPNNKTFYCYSNMVVASFLEYHNIWRAIEQDITEKALSNEYKGSTSYLFAHRNFYLDKKYISVLEEAVQYFDIEWLPKVWHLLIIHNILNKNKIFKLHPVYKKIQDIAEKTLIVDPFESAEVRFASVAELIGKVCDFMEELKTQNVSMKDLGFGDQENNSDETNFDQEVIPSPLAKQLERITKDISKSGLGEALTKSSEIITTKSHKNLVHNSLVFDVSDQNALRFFELENMGYGMSHVSVMNDEKYIREMILDKYNKIVDKNKSYIDYLKETMLIRSFDFIAEDYSMKSGYVDENNLWKLSFKNEDAENIFYQRSLPKTSDNVQIAILFDNSGSMSQSSANLEQSRICICNKIAVVLNEVVKSLTNVKIDFYSFSDRNFYSFEKDVYAIANQNPMGSTNEGLALAKTVYNMETFRVNNPEKFYGKRYLFAVGDGYTNPEDVHKTLEFMRNNTNIRFFHFGIDNAYTPEYGKMLYGENNFTIIPSSDLMYHLCTAIVKLLS